MTLVPDGGSCRLVCNRDERHERPLALPPGPARHRDTPDRPLATGAVFPVDPDSGGTWIAVTEAGLGFALLNRTIADRPVAAGTRSRGEVIPLLIGHRQVDDALAALARFDAAHFNLFRLVITDGQRVGVATSDGRSVAFETFALTLPLLFTSSSLGDHVVEGPRRALFERMLLSGRRGWLRGQYAFHRHRWAHSPHLSIVMSRRDACTVSRTTVDLASRRLRYERLPRRS